MKVYTEIYDGEDLARYLRTNSWSGAKDRIDSYDWNSLISECNRYLSENDYDDLELSETELNDVVWFDDNYFNNEEDEDELEEDETEDYLEDKVA